MPDVIFLMTKTASQLLSDRVFDTMSAAVAEAVSTTLKLAGPHAVATYEIVANRSRNVSPIQVICISTKTEARLKKLPLLRDNIGKALANLSGDRACSAFFNMMGGTIESWPIMPDGSWKEVSVG